MENLDIQSKGLMGPSYIELREIVVKYYDMLMSSDEETQNLAISLIISDLTLKYCYIIVYGQNRWHTFVNEMKDLQYFNKWAREFLIIRNCSILLELLGKFYTYA